MKSTTSIHIRFRFDSNSTFDAKAIQTQSRTPPVAHHAKTPSTSRTPTTHTRQQPHTKHSRHPPAAHQALTPSTSHTPSTPSTQSSRQPHTTHTLQTPAAHQPPKVATCRTPAAHRPHKHQAPTAHRERGSEKLDYGRSQRGVDHYQRRG